MTGHYRIERDSMGEVRVPADALYRAQTQRAVENFPISGVVWNALRSARWGWSRPPARG
jgi:fumarate hydratase class II